MWVRAVQRRGWVAVSLACALWSQTARAEGESVKRHPVFVLDIESDDAEDQAEALTQALRSRVRYAPGLALAEANQTLGTLMIVLKCPPKPDAACLARVANQLRADRFFWGTMNRTPGAPTVSVEVHLWTRNGPDVTVKESFHENVKDAGDESLQKVVGRILEKVGAVALTGTLVVQSPQNGATVLVDGTPKGTVDQKTLRLDLPLGQHTVEVRDADHTPMSKSVEVPFGATVLATFGEAPPNTPASGPPPPPPAFPTRAVLGWSSIGLGVITGGLAILEGSRFVDLRSALDEARKEVPSTQNDVCDPVTTQRYPQATIACDYANRARTARALAFVFGGAAAALATTGIVLLSTGSSSHDDATPPKKEGAAPSNVVATPLWSPGFGGVSVQGRF